MKIISRKEATLHLTYEFRKQAEDARKMAARAMKTKDKAFWLRMAEDWAKLAQAADERREGR